MKHLIFALALLCAFSSVVSAAEESSLKLKTEVPYREDSGLTKAEYYLAKDKNAEALEEANAVLQRHPKSADAYAYRGLAYMRLGDLAKAKTSFARAIAINPTHMGANKYLADAYLENGDLGLALDQMQVLRLACGKSLDCPEMDALQSAINQAKKKKKSE